MHASLAPAIAVQEDKEPGEFIKLFTPKEWVDRPVGTRKLKSDVRLFLCSGASGVVTVRGPTFAPLLGAPCG